MARKMKRCKVGTKRVGKSCRRSTRSRSLGGTPEEHSFKGKAAMRDAMKHEHAAAQAAQSGNCAGAAKHAGQMLFAMGQADAHGALPNAAYVRMLHAGDKAVNAACATGAMAGLKRKRRSPAKCKVSKRTGKKVCPGHVTAAQIRAQIRRRK